MAPSLTAQQLLHRVDHPLGAGDHVADIVARLVPEAHAGHQLLPVAASAGARINSDTSSRPVSS